MQKAFAWLEENKLAYTFHDYKKEGAQVADLKRWSERAGWEKLLNRSGLTWKKQSPETQKGIVDQDSAVLFMQSNTSAIKRPIFECNDMIIVGFSEQELSNILLR